MSSEESRKLQEILKNLITFRDKVLDTTKDVTKSVDEINSQVQCLSDSSIENKLQIGNESVQSLVELKNATTEFFNNTRDDGYNINSFNLERKLAALKKRVEKEKKEMENKTQFVKKCLLELTFRTRIFSNTTDDKIKVTSLNQEIDITNLTKHTEKLKKEQRDRQQFIHLLRRTADNFAEIINQDKDKINIKEDSSQAPPFPTSSTSSFSFFDATSANLATSSPLAKKTESSEDNCDNKKE